MFRDPRPLLVLLSALAGPLAAQEPSEILVLKERRARLERERAELEAQVVQLQVRVDRVKEELAGHDLAIRRLSRQEGSPAPADLAALGLEAGRLGLGNAWDGIAATWRAEALGGLALRELRRTGDRLRETAEERRRELAEILSYVRELGLAQDDLARVASSELLDQAESWREELLRIHVARTVGLDRLIEHFARPEGEDGIVPALERERQESDARHRRRLQSYLMRIVRERPIREGS